MECSPELAVASFIDFVGSKDGDVAFQGSFHGVCLAVEDSCFSWLAMFEDRGLFGNFVGRAQTDWDFSSLYKGVWHYTVND